MSDKTEEPTPKRLKRAREQGDGPVSAFASQSVAFVCATVVAPAAVGALASRAAVDLRAAIAHAADRSGAVDFDVAELGAATIVLTAPILAAVAAASAVSSLVQSGGVVAMTRLAPDLGRLDPFQGLLQIVSAQRLVAVLRAALFAAAVAWTVYSTLTSHAGSFAHVAGRLDAAAGLAGALALDVARRAGILGLALGVLDIVVTRRAWRKRLMMTKAEVKREHRESDGDPELKAARERAHREAIAAATIARVRDATVVVINPTHVACALEYDEDRGDEAPVLVAAGHGDLARRIVEAAHQYGVPVLRDIPLARALAELEVGSEIPEALYEAVAEILREAWDEGRSG